MTKTMRMYSDYFGIRENAFAITPDPRYLFMSERHREALAHLLFGTEEGGGFVQLTGEVGTGKTTICRAFLEQLPQNVDVALLLNPPESARELLLGIITELRLPLSNRAAPVRELVEQLNEYLLRAHANDRRTVVIIDEAQNISNKVLEQVRLLTNLETATHKLLQVFLIGQPELRQKLQQPELRQVAQRITARFHLQPLTLSETKGYIRHRLAVAGCRQGLFSPEAIKQIYRQSEGIPRVINILCDRALLGAFVTDSAEVNGTIARHAAREWRGTSGRWHTVSPLARPAITAALVGITFVAAAGFAANTHTNQDDGIVEMARMGAKSVSEIYKSMQSQPISDSSEIGETVAPLTPVKVSKVEPVISVSNTGTPVDAMQKQATVASAQVELETVSVQSAIQTGGPVALRALLDRWNINKEAYVSLSFCDEVVRHGLQCLRDNGGWRNLHAYNRPGLLKLNNYKGEDAYIAIVRMTREHAVVATINGPRRVPYDELDAYWGGEFVILWRPPIEGVSLIGRDETGLAFSWLQEALGRFDGKALTSTVYDDKIEQRLRSFQKSRGLKADGIAGPRTLIQLNTLVGGPAIPQLVAAQREIG